MITDSNFPTTLQKAVKYFSDELVCINLVAKMRWFDGIATCPICQSKETSFLATRKIWKCKNKTCKKQFSVKINRFR